MDSTFDVESICKKIIINEVRMKKILLLCIFPILIVAQTKGFKPVEQQANEQRIALVIGNSKYATAPLRNPENDATDISSTLRDLNFKVFSYTNLSAREMENAIGSFGEKINANTVALFYYSGHGVQVAGKNYLIPVKANIQKEQDVKFEAVDVERVLAEMENAKSKLNIVILDACRDNPLPRSVRSTSRGLATIDAPVGTFIAYSTAPGKVASDGNGRNGLYTEYLIQYLQTSGLKIEDVFKKVRAEVASKSNGAQTPWENSSMTGDFYFSGGTSTYIKPTNESLKPEKKKSSDGFSLDDIDKEIEAKKAEEKRVVTEREEKEKRVATEREEKLQTMRDAFNKVQGILKENVSSEKKKFAKERFLQFFVADLDWTNEDEAMRISIEIEAKKAEELRITTEREEKEKRVATEREEKLQTMRDAFNKVKAILKENVSNEKKKIAKEQFLQFFAVDLDWTNEDEVMRNRIEIEAKKAEEQRIAIEREEKEKRVATEREEKLQTMRDEFNKVQAILEENVTNEKKRLARENFLQLFAADLDWTNEDEVMRKRLIIGSDLEFVFVQGGTFQMGSNDGSNDEKPIHSVTVSDFYIRKYEVTQKQWQAVMGTNPSNWKRENLPVEQVSWNDIQQFIAKLNESSGKTYRLPTEAEWEYAARGGKFGVDRRQLKGDQLMYSGSDSLDTVAWYRSNSDDKIHEVGIKQPNELGIYDMSGNVWEWCNDWFDEHYYENSSQTNPQGPSSGTYRALRGGSWSSNVNLCRVAYRLRGNPNNRDDDNGFRLVRTK